MGGQGTFDGCDQDLCVVKHFERSLRLTLAPCSVKESTVAQLCKKFDVDETKLKSYLGRRGWTKTADQQRKSASRAAAAAARGEWRVASAC